MLSQALLCKNCCTLYAFYSDMIKMLDCESMKCEAIRENAYSAFKQHIRNLRKGSVQCGEAKRDGRIQAYIFVCSVRFFVFLLHAWSAFSGA